MIEQATSNGQEVVTIGARCLTEDACTRHVLASPDGLTWMQRGVLPEEVNLVADLIADEGALLVVGNSEGVPAGRQGPFIWRSMDGGASWEGLNDAQAFGPGGDGRPARSPAGNPYHLSVLSVARGPAGLVAGGWLNSEDLDRSAVWLSIDGVAWERVRLPRAMDRAGGVFDIAADAAGYVAVTGDGLWRSGDGQRWERAMPEQASEEAIAQVESIESGFVGLGGGWPQPSIWVSGPDGASWKRQADDPGLMGLWEAELRGFGPLVLAIGSSDADAAMPTVWTLQPGSGWAAEPVSSDEDAYLADVVMIDDAPLIVGASAAHDGTTSGAAWRRVEP